MVDAHSGNLGDVRLVIELRVTVDGKPKGFELPAYGTTGHDSMDPVHPKRDSISQDVSVCTSPQSDAWDREHRHWNFTPPHRFDVFVNANACIEMRVMSTRKASNSVMSKLENFFPQIPQTRESRCNIPAGTAVLNVGHDVLKELCLQENGEVGDQFNHVEVYRTQHIFPIHMKSRGQRNISLMFLSCDMELPMNLSPVESCNALREWCNKDSHDSRSDLLRHVGYRQGDRQHVKSDILKSRQDSDDLLFPSEALLFPGRPAVSTPNADKSKHHDGVKSSLPNSHVPKSFDPEYLQRVVRRRVSMTQRNAWGK